MPDQLKKRSWVEPPVEIKYTDAEVFRVYYLHVEVAAPYIRGRLFRAFLDLKGSIPASKPSGLIPVIASLVPRIQTFPQGEFILRHSGVEVRPFLTSARSYSLRPNAPNR